MYAERTPAASSRVARGRFHHFESRIVRKSQGSVALSGFPFFLEYVTYTSSTSTSTGVQRWSLRPHSAVRTWRHERSKEKPRDPLVRLLGLEPDGKSACPLPLGKGVRRREGDPALLSEPALYCTKKALHQERTARTRECASFSQEKDIAETSCAKYNLLHQDV